MSRISFESDRISLTESRDQLELIISGRIPSNQFTMLTAWLIAWTLSGLFVMSQMFSVGGDQLMYMAIWLAFWAYFEYRIGSVWLWRKFGREVLRIQGDKVELRFEVAYGGRAYEFRKNEVSGLKNLEAEKGTFVRQFYSSFWTMGGESLGFSAQKRLHTFGRQLPEHDVKVLYNRLRNYIPA